MHSTPTFITVATSKAIITAAAVLVVTMVLIQPLFAPAPPDRHGIPTFAADDRAELTRTVETR